MRMTGYKLERSEIETNLSFERCIDFMAELMEKYAHMLPNPLPEKWIELEVSGYDTTRVSFMLKLPMENNRQVA